MLNLCANDIGATAAAALAPALAAMTRLRELHLGDNPQLGARGTKALAPALMALGPSLQVLDLSCTALGEGGVAALTLALSCMGRLGKLWLVDDDLGLEQAHALGPALASMWRLSDLDISFNRDLGVEGCRVVCEALREARTPVDVVLQGIGLQEGEVQLQLQGEGLRLHF